MYSVLFSHVNIIESYVPPLVSTLQDRQRNINLTTVPSIATDVAHNYCWNVLWVSVNGGRRIYHCLWGSIDADLSPFWLGKRDSA